MEILGNAFIGLLTGALGAIIAAIISMNRFYNEKWWDKKADLFIQLVDCLYELKKVHNYWYLKELEGHSGQDEGLIRLGEKEERELQKTYVIELNKLERIRDISPLLLTDSCHVQISAFLSSQASLSSDIDDGAISTFEAHETSYTEMCRLFDSIIREARAELKSDRKHLKSLSSIKDKLVKHFKSKN